MGTDEGPMTLRNATEVLFLTAMFYAAGSLAFADRFDALIWWRDATRQAADIIAFYAGPDDRAPGAGSDFVRGYLGFCGTEMDGRVGAGDRRDVSTSSPG
jgi:hypothetical protein